MAGTLTDAEKLMRIRDIIAEEERLEAFHRGLWDADQLAQASAFSDIRRFLYEEEGYPDSYPKPRRPV